MPTIGLCLIAKNEEENINRLYDSIQGCFDKIYLTDTGSTDKTVEIAKSLGMEVSHFSWIDDFSAARNYCFSQAKTDYIMWLDLDDTLTGKEDFIIWKNSIMGLADMWLATYDYAHREDGTPMCVFARERVIKNNIGLKWKYFVHEGILPTSDQCRKITANYAITWKVKHMRTEQDLAKDRSRNLQIIEKNRDNLDARMTYYYGKELFENKREFDAIQPLMKACADKSLELHDRVLALQYACYALMKCNQNEKAMDVALTALQIAPQRAEFHCIIGDCFIKMNRHMDAAPYYRAASECINNNSGHVAQPIFSTAEQYTIYPSNQLSKIYANSSRIDEAIAESKKTAEKYKDNEAKTILAECEKIKEVCVGYKKAKPCEDIVITCPPNAPYKWDPGIYKEQAMGGSETAAIEMAYWLRKISGRPVKVFNVRDDEIAFNGVEYAPTTKINAYMAEHKPYLHIAWRHNFKITDAPTFVWSHDLTTPGVEAHGNYVKVLALTEFHRNYLHLTQNVPYEKILTTRNGIVPERFTEIDQSQKDPNMFVFSSSPDRGLERAMLVLDRVRESHPDIRLHVFYGVEHLDKYGLKDMRVKLEKMLEARKSWVTYHGKTPQWQLMEYFKRAAYNIQPSDWIETSCITAMELVLSGVYPIFRKVGGVVDTLKKAHSLGMCSLVESDCITESDYQRFIDETNRAIDEKRYLCVKMDAKPFAWETVAKEWLEELPKLAYGSI